MAMFGIEFTSIMSQILFSLVFLAIIVGCVWLLIRLRQRDKHVTQLRNNNTKLRNEIANITGWTVEGRLPENWQEKLRSLDSGAVAQVLSSAENSNDPILMVAHTALATIDPPYFASKNTSENMEREHRRIVQLLDGLARGNIEPEQALANGDFDKLICMCRRLESYFPDETETFAYALATNAVLNLLKKHTIQILAPRPLTVTKAENCEFTTDDGEALRDITRIRAAAQLNSAYLTTILQPNEEIVVDCQRLGWNSPNGLTKPKVLVLDKSW